MTRTLLSAYTAAPRGLSADRGGERRWYGYLRSLRDADGIELAMTADGLHPLGVEHLDSLLDSRWDLVVSTMALTTAASVGDPDFGLGSADPDGRRAAVDRMRRVQAQVSELAHSRGSGPLAVVLHAAPRADRASADGLRRSLEELSAWDWAGARLLLEHADALMAGRPPQKGWQALEVELDVVDRVNRDSGAALSMLLNWGRSVIEARSIATARAHLDLVVARGLLGAYAVSGASGDPAARGGAWADVHLGMSTDEPLSLLTPTELSIVDDLPDPLFVGVKTMAPDSSEQAPDRRLRSSAAIVRALRDRR